MAKLIILSETTKQMTEKAVHASRADGSKSSFTCNCLLLHEAFNISLPFASSTQAT